MPDINIISRQATNQAWQFTVTVGPDDDFTQHAITIHPPYFHQLTAEKISPEDLLLESLNFLLQREKKESILPRFNLKQINDYFPGFEHHIKNHLSST